MTSDEHNRQCDHEAVEFFTWLEGYMDGMRSRPVDCSDVFKLNERTESLLRHWSSRGALTVKAGHSDATG